MASSRRTFACTFSKTIDADKKRRKWQEGIFTIDETNSSGTLLDHNNQKVAYGKPTLNDNLLQSGAEFSLRNYDIQLDDETTTDENDPTQRFVSHTSKKLKSSDDVAAIAQSSHASSSSSSSFRPPQSSHASSSSSSSFRPPQSLLQVPSSSSSSSSSLTSIGDRFSSLQIDNVLLRRMRPHQKEGSQFILECLKGKAVRKSGDVSELESGPGSGSDTLFSELIPPLIAENVSDRDDDDDDDNDDFERLPEKKRVNTPEKETRYTGCICADEMGLGKSFQATAVLAAFTKSKKVRGLIVCPSSLISNWTREIQKWMSVAMVPLVITPGCTPSPAEKIKSFGTNAKNFVMIMSFEMFRKHVEELNQVSSLEVLVIDEAHKIKAVSDNKINQAMRSCKATRRLLLTGSPIQNNLDELYSVVNFACPGFFGSLATFRRKYSNSIQACSDPRASNSEKRQGHADADKLKRMLSHILIRRTQHEVLKKVLPPRTDVIIFCKLSDAQNVEYEETAAKVLGDSRDSSLDEAVVESEPTELVLPTLQALRRICNYALPPLGPLDRLDDAKVAGQASKLLLEIKPGQFRPPTRVAPSNPPVISSKSSFFSTVDIPTFLRNSSSKFMLLDEILKLIRELSPHEKCVVVSHFTETLNLVHELAKFRGYECLMIQGSVAIENRQSLVDRFNRNSDPSFLLLLSSKAGGVGLNLPGGSRLIALDVDWNPAIDIQAQARVWREGQTRPVFVYRFCAAEKIESTMLTRQFSKGELVTNVMEDEGGNFSEGPGDDGTSLGGLPQKLLNNLIYPSSNTSTDEYKFGKTLESFDHDDILARLVENLPKIILSVVECTR